MKSINYILFTLSIIIASCTSKIDFTPKELVPVGQTSDLIISEITTSINTDPLLGGKRNHYVEIYNGTNANIDLSNYAIGYYAVTDTGTLSSWTFDSTTYLPLQNSLSAKKCFVVASNASDISIIRKSNLTWGTKSTAAADASKPLQLSGNSAIALLKKDATGSYLLGGFTYKIIDVFGSPLVPRIISSGAVSSRNNIMWAIAGENNDTRNRTFIRKGSVASPTSNWDLSRGTAADNSQWIISQDRLWDYTNLGISTTGTAADTTVAVLPTVTTNAVNNIGIEAAMCGGNITNNGGGSIIERGVCWSALPNPTIALTTKTSDGFGNGVFVSSLTGLTANTTYYVKAYATNSAGTAYGNEIQFTTNSIPHPTELLISEISTAINTDPLAGPGAKRSHYVELFNATGSSVDLTNYAIGYYATTDTFTLADWSFPANTFLFLNGSINNNTCYVIGSNASDTLITNRSNTTWGTTSILSADASKPLQLSGNSAIALLKKDPNGTYDVGGTMYKIIDVFGSPLVARVTSTGSVSSRNNIMWTIAGEVSDTRNRTFKRKSTVTAPTTDWNMSKGTTVDDSQWILSGSRAWDYTNLGLPTP